MPNMLICNLIEERYKLLKKEQFGLNICTDTYLSMLNQQYGLYLNCSGIVLCYTPETCTIPITDACDITVEAETLGSITCDTLTITIL